MPEKRNRSGFLEDMLKGENLGNTLKARVAARDDTAFSGSPRTFRMRPSFFIFSPGGMGEKKAD